MVCEYNFISDPLYHHTWSCLQHYNYKEAIFTAERIFAENPNEESIYLLATCFYRSNGPKQAKNFMLRQETMSGKCRYLLAKCYMDLGNSAEAENALLGVNEELDNPTDIVDFYKEVSPFVLRMLADIFKQSERRKLAISYLKKCLEINPLCWTSYTELIDLNDNVDPLEVFSLPKDAVLNNQSCLRALSNKINIGEIVHSNCPSKKRSDLHDSQEDLSVSRENVNPKCEEKTLDSVSSSDMIHLTEEQISYSFNRSDIHNNSIADHLLPDSNIIQTNIQTRQKIYAPRQMRREIDEMEIEPSKPLFGNVCVSSSPAMYGFGPVFKMKCSQITNQAYQKKNRNNNLVGRPSFSKTTFSTPKHSNPVNNYRISQYSPITSISPLVADQSKPNFDCSTLNINVDSGSYPVSSTDLKVPGPRTRLQTAKAAAAQKCSYKKECTHADEECGDHHSNQESDSRLESILNYLQLLCSIGKAYKYLRTFKLHDCVSQIKQLPRQHLETAAVSIWLGRAYLEMNDAEQAYSILSKSYQNEPWQLHCVVLLSSVCWILNKESELVCLAKDIMDMDRTLVEYWCVLGNCASFNKENDNALRFFQRVVQINPSYSYGYLLLGQEYLAQDELDKALTSFRRAGDLDGHNYHSSFFIAAVYQRQNKHIDAESVLKDALKIFPDAYNVLTTLAVVRSKLKQNYSSESVLELLDRACSLYPKESKCRYQRAMILYQNGRYKESLEDLKLVHLKEPRLFLMMSTVYKEIGNLQKAMLYNKWAVDLDPKCSSETFSLERHYNIGGSSNLSINDQTNTSTASQNMSFLSSGRRNSESMQEDSTSNNNHATYDMLDTE